MKNINIRTKLVSLILAGTLTLSATSCGKKEENELMPMKDLLQIEEVQDLTLLDELIEKGYLYYGLSSNIIDQASNLEKLIKMVELTSEMNYQEVYANIDDYKEKEKTFNTNINLWQLTIEEVETLREKAKMTVSSYNDIDTRQKALQMLYYINQSAREMIKNNARNTLILLLLTVIRASTAEGLSLDIEEFKEVNILDSEPSKTKEDPYYIIVKDEPYEVTPSKKELWEAMDYVFQLRKEEKETEGKEPKYHDIDFYKKGLTLAKMVILEGIKVKNGTIKQEHSASYVKKHYGIGNEK